MTGIHIKPDMDADQLVKSMQEDARYELDDGDLATADALMSIRRLHKAKPAPPKVPKVFLSNECAFNCAYCGCRSGNELKTCYRSTPRQLAELSVKQAIRARRGIFLSSAVLKNADYTEELIVETLRIIRGDLGFRGYVHAKVMPGADRELIRRAGLYADRLSVNIEVARSEGYAQIARNKNRVNILTPMEQISRLIAENKPIQARRAGSPRFATSQTTQLMAGSTGEDDRTILTLSGALYRKYRLSRVYYTAFQYRHRAAGYDDLPFTSTPAWRMARLYQADRLMQLYGFTADEIAPDIAPNLTRELDPKAAWALHHLDQFPVEVNKADYETLIRVPGIGLTYAKRIMEARRQTKVTHDILKILGVSLKRSRHFITCMGRYEGASWNDASTLHPLLAEKDGAFYQQMSFLQDICDA